MGTFECDEPDVNWDTPIKADALRTYAAKKGSMPRFLKLSDQARKKAVAAESIYSEGKLSVSEIARNLEISKSTLYKYLRHQGVEIGAPQKTE